MEVTGQAIVGVPAASLFDAICDPAVLLAVIPGCEAVERASDDEYRASFALRLPGLAGRYDAVVRLVRAEAPRLGELRGTITGRAGSVTGEASFQLSGAGPDRTLVDYRATGTVTGPLARLDGRFVEGLVGSLVADGLRRLEERLASESRPTSEARAASEPVGTSR